VNATRNVLALSKRSQTALQAIKAMPYGLFALALKRTSNQFYRELFIKWLHLTHYFAEQNKIFKAKHRCAVDGE
jgi:hypothetical protein